MQIRTRTWVRAALALVVVLSTAIPAGSMVANAASSPAGAHLTYYGGKVISNVNVVQVIWGAGTYLPQVTSTGSPSVSSFYKGVTNSRYFDVLSEYSTSFPLGTNQTIGRGSFGGMYTINPPAAGDSIDSTLIESDLSYAIQHGPLPPPQSDATGHPNTLYAIFLRHGQAVTVNGVSSASGQFCAYHGAIAQRSGLAEIYYAVQPDLTGVTGCGTGSDFQNTTTVASHELINAVTDPELALASGTAAPIAWFDTTNAEIADICNAQQGRILGGDGVRYTVQKAFSNQVNDCILTRPLVQDFSILATPQSIPIRPGGRGNETRISTTLVSGAAERVDLSVSGQPPGVTTSLHPNSVIDGRSAILTFSASILTPPGQYTVTVTGTSGATTHHAQVTLLVFPITPVIVNGGFEPGLAGWTTSGPATSVVTSDCHTGASCARLGSTLPTNGSSSIAQTFTAPVGSSTLSMWYKQSCPDSVTYDWAVATLRDNTTSTTTTIIPPTCVLSPAWTSVSASVVVGHSYTLTLTNHDDNFAGDPTYTLFDDVSVF